MTAAPSLSLQGRASKTTGPTNKNTIQSQDARKATHSQREKLRELIARESIYPISQSLADELIDMGTIIRLKSGDAITRAGDIDSDFYILIDGIMRCWHTEGEGEVERTSYFGLPGTVCISYHSYLLGQPSPTIMTSAARLRLCG